jgi:hypothetical protein
MSWGIFCGAISVIIGRIVQVCFLQTMPGNPPRRSIVVTKLIISQSISKHMEDRGVILKHGRGSKTVTSE